MSARSVALLTMVTIAMLGPAMPPSRPKPGLSWLEHSLEQSVFLLLGLGLLLAGLGAALDPSKHVRRTRSLVVLGLVLLNLAAVFGSRFGVETLGVTIPAVASVILLGLLYGTVWGGSGTSR